MARMLPLFLVLIPLLGCSGDPSEHPSILALKSEYGLERVGKAFSAAPQKGAVKSAQIHSPVSVSERGEKFVANEVLVKYSGVDVDEGFEVLRSRSPQFDMQKAIEDFKQNRLVEVIAPNVIYQISSVPSDPLFEKEWHLENQGRDFLQVRGLTGRVVKGKTGADIHALDAWEFFDSHTDGKTQVIVAVIDTGVDLNHEDLADQIWVNEKETGTDEWGADRRSNRTDDDGNGYVDDWCGWNFYRSGLGELPAELAHFLEEENDPDDILGHGTHVAGIIGAVSDNGQGVSAVGRGTRVMALRASDTAGALEESDILNAIRYAVDNGASVINLSCGSPVESEILRLAVKYAHDRGVLLVAAAGNDGKEEIQYPGGYEEVVAVMASDPRDERAWFSNWGSHIDIAAPGVGILSTVPRLLMHSAYEVWDGTSMAVPIVSAVLATMKNLYPELSKEELTRRLLSTADRVDRRGQASETQLGVRRLNFYRALRGK